MFEMEYELIKEQRRTATISVNDALEVIVKVPSFMSKQQVDQFVNNNKEWIEKTKEAKKQQTLKNDWLLTGKVLYLGEYWPVEIKKALYQKPYARFNKEKGFTVFTDGTEACSRKQMETFFRQSALTYLSELTKEYARRIDVTYNKITIRKQATRWGSCSSNGNLSYNLKIMCAPKEMIEYVILHEVMHLRHFDHSKMFWQDIASYMPDYKDRMHYFKTFGQNFMI